MKTKLVLIVLSLIGSVGFAAEKVAKKETNTASQASVLDDIKSTLGMVPTFMKEFPPEALPGAWMEFKGIELSNKTALDPKTKELIGLAVASQVPCRYCVYFHKKAATFHGAKGAETTMAIAVAASTRKWSTHLYGSQQDMKMFKTDIDKMVAMMKKNTEPTDKTPLQVVDSKSAYKDMENSLGFVPEFMKSYPEAGIAGAWLEFKGLEMNPQTALTSKTKDLISLAVASQTPCQYCAYADSEFAKVHGATVQEIKEAIAVAGVVRHWSTVLNGLRQDEKVFEKEVDQIFKHLESTKPLAPKKVTRNDN